MRIPAPVGQGDETRVVAYVDWFMCFASQLWGEGKMYRIQTAYQMGAPKHCDCAVIDIESIRRPCHLIPSFGERIPMGWRSWNVLELADTFLLAP